jgi:CheY-like chemotaxis protein
MRYTTHFLKDGASVLKYLTNQPPYEDVRQFVAPQLLLLDLGLPGISGFEVLEWLSLRPQYENMATVVLSASTSRGDIARARALGARHYLIKPTTLNELTMMVKSLETFRVALSLSAQPTSVGPPA